MRKLILLIFAGLTTVCQAQFDVSIEGADTLCIDEESIYSVEINTYNNEYFFRDTVSSGYLGFGYNGNVITNTFSFDLWVKPTRTIGMAVESNTCSGGVSVPLANSNQNWAVYAGNSGPGNMGVGLTIGTNGLMVGEHSDNILVSRLSYTTAITDWVHVAVVYRTDKIFLYLNGNLVRERPTPCTSNSKYVPGAIAVSRYSPEFKGNIDEFRLWDIALSQDQTQYLMDKKLLSNVDGLRYYASFDNGKFERTLGDLGTVEMLVTGVSENNHLKQSSWDLEKYTGETIDALIPFEDNSYQYLWSTGSTEQTTVFLPSDTINKLLATVYNASLSKSDSLVIIGENCCSKWVYDTIITEVFDTTYVTINDTVPVYDTIPVYEYISVTDTLIIDAVLTGIDPPDNLNTLKVYPNPAKDHIFINTGDYTRMNGYSLKIIDQLGAVVFETNVEEPLYEINLSTWTGMGLYYVQVIDSGGSIIDIRKIVLQ